ncbi:unnamed protein product [Psylliodes chrysocephalus]|uniref:Uncharacterized protein n=1 Tax=Psylliodes chrysocephalus TaxID=3402493 RepID=A0A9P0CCU2_9CUCU|nr:unnamed protein product [Psylliodes chrysocephala]
MRALYLDERRDKTMCQEEIRKIKIEEHISLLKEPGLKYMSHYTNNRKEEWSFAAFRNKTKTSSAVDDMSATDHHIFQYLNEETSGSRIYSGAIEKMLESWEKLPVVNFVPIVYPLLELDAAAIRNLSTDQKNLYEMCHLIYRENCSLYSYLAARNPVNYHTLDGLQRQTVYFVFTPEVNVHLQI